MASREDEEILALWRNPSFYASFSGLSNFQHGLWLEKHIWKSKKDLFAILRKDPNFLLETRRVKKHIFRRSFVTHGLGKLWQADLGELFSFDGYVAFLVCVDVFSRRIFAKPLKAKTKVAVEQAFREIFKEANLSPEKLETDQGSEFKNEQFFRTSDVYHKIKIGRNKANFAEHAILLIKTRLYRLMRTLLTRNWPKYLSQVVRNINETPNSAIGGLKPSEIKTPGDGTKIDAKVGLPEDVSFSQQMKNQEKYERNVTKLQKNDYVFADFPPSTMEKSFDTKRHQVFIVDHVDAGKTPPLYKIKDLMGALQPGYFYREQLIETEEPTANHFFKIERIIKKRKINGKVHYLVKYLHYPAKFNQWLPKENFLEQEKK